MTRDRLREIARINRIEITVPIIECMKQAADEAAQAMKAKYLECWKETDIVLDCETCKEKQRLQYRKDFQREVRELFHVKGWDE